MRIDRYNPESSFGIVDLEHNPEGFRIDMDIRNTLKNIESPLELTGAYEKFDNEILEILQAIDLELAQQK